MLTGNIQISADEDNVQAFNRIENGKNKSYIVFGNPKGVRTAICFNDLNQFQSACALFNIKDYEVKNQQPKGGIKTEEGTIEHQKVNRYRKTKPVQAIQFMGSKNIKAVQAFIKVNNGDAVYQQHTSSFIFTTATGPQELKSGSFAVSQNNEVYPVTYDVFLETYELV